MITHQLLDEYPILKKWLEEESSSIVVMEEQLDELSELIMIFRKHKQYDYKFKREYLNELFIDKGEHNRFKSLRVNYPTHSVIYPTHIRFLLATLKFKNSLNILNLDNVVYTYDELKKHFLCFNSRYSKVYDSNIYRNYLENEKYIHWIFVNPPYYYDFCEKKSFFSKCKRASIRLYEDYCNYSILSTLSYVSNKINYNFNKIEEELKILKCNDNRILNKIYGLAYNHQFPFQDDIARFTKNGKYGLINKNQKIIFEAQFDFLEKIEYKEIYIFTQNSKLGVLDINGNILFDANFDDINDIPYNFNS